MKKKITLLLIVIMTVSILFAGCSPKQTSTNDSQKQSAASGQNNTQKQSADNSLSDIKKKGKFVVGLDDAFPPMGFRDDKNQIVGFDIDLAKEAAKRMGVEVEFKPVEWDGVVMSLKNKDIDVIWNGLTITEKRKAEIDFSKVYLENRQIIVVKADSKIAGKADLEGKVVGLQSGSSSEEALAADDKTKKSLKDIKKYEKNTEALMELANGRVDAVVVDEVVGRYYISKKPGVYKVLNDDFGKEQYGVGIRKEDKSFREELDKVLDQMKADGTAEKISKQWFGENIVVK